MSQKNLISLVLVISACLLFCASPSIVAQESVERQPVSTDVVTDTLLPTGEVIRPAGKLIPYPGRPIDCALDSKNKRLFVKDRSSILVIDTAKFEIIQTLELPGGASINGIRVTESGLVLVTNAKQSMHVFAIQGNQNYSLARSIELPAGCYPCGLAVSRDGKSAYVALSKHNKIAVIDLEAGKVTHQIEVGVAPFDVALTTDSKRLIVSNIAGRRAEEGDATATSAGTKVVVDERGIASTGSVSIIDLESYVLVQSVPVGLQPSVLQCDSDSVTVCNTNQDSLTVIDLQSFKATEVVVKPEENYPFGSMPNGMASSVDGKTLFVALAGNNAVAVVGLTGNEWVVRGLIPTAWFPAGLACDEEFLYVCNTKGFGARTVKRDVQQGRNSHDHQGVIQRISLAEINIAEKLGGWSKFVRGYSTLLGEKRMADTAIAKEEIAVGVKPIPVPKKLGEPSVFKHVIYVIKENRTFDQVFGDISEARSEPKLCIFPEALTPNHHGLARRFGVLDNYYCNGVLSADGHSWATEGNVTPYLERAFGGFTRSYTFGDDPITYSSSGFIWDRILGAGLSFRNYGEMDYAKIRDGGKYQDVWRRYSDGVKEEFDQQVGIERLRRYTCRNYPGWNMSIPDVLRVERFLEEFRKFESDGGLPNLSMVYLPQDHLGGGVTGRAHMADNDLALGRLVEAVSKSKYWESTVILVNEDDPQNGFDHIDGHRSICLVISPYSQPGINHNFYNQTSVLRTILQIFGLPPLNQKDAASPLMTACFSESMVNAEPFIALPASVPLNELPTPAAKQSSIEKKWRGILATVPIERTGMKTPQDEDNLNRFIWHEQKGWEVPYPVQYAGSHGKGLAAIRLVRTEDNKD